MCLGLLLDGEGKGGSEVRFGDEGASVNFKL